MSGVTDKSLLAETVDGQMESPQLAAPRKWEDLAELQSVTANLAIKFAATVPHFHTEWMVQQTRLPHSVVEDMLWKLKNDKVVEILGKAGAFSYRYAISNLGLELSRRLMDICGYLGPAPVSLKQYFQVVESQFSDQQRVSVSDVKAATESLVVPESVHEVAALAALSQRSLFIFGPSGNGKSTLGRMIHNVIKGDCWIPHSIAIDEQVIRVFDPEVHDQVQQETNVQFDDRWVRIKRPLIVSGGEMTAEQLDLVYHPDQRYYEAPPHLKANCGTFFIDDLGRQRVRPDELLNRWIMPLERHIDYLSLASGTKIKIPFRMLLIVATNLTTSDVADPAFLRRMGYRIHLDAPPEADMRRIIRIYGRQLGFEIDEALENLILERYRAEKRRWRASEPRDLLLRCRDVCRLREIDQQLDAAILDVAWRGYFADCAVEQAFSF